MVADSFVLDEGHPRIPTPALAIHDRPYPPQPPGCAVHHAIRRRLEHHPRPCAASSAATATAARSCSPTRGPTPDRWFSSGTNHKVESLRRLAEVWVKWILVGDDRQRDDRLQRLRGTLNNDGNRHPQSDGGEHARLRSRQWSDYCRTDDALAALWIKPLTA